MILHTTNGLRLLWVLLAWYTFDELVALRRILYMKIHYAIDSFDNSWSNWFHRKCTKLGMWAYLNTEQLNTDLEKKLHFPVGQRDYSIMLELILWCVSLFCCCCFVATPRVAGGWGLLLEKLEGLYNSGFEPDHMVFCLQSTCSSPMISLSLWPQTSQT